MPNNEPTHDEIELTGGCFLGSAEYGEGKSFSAVSPLNGKKLAPPFVIADEGLVQQAGIYAQAGFEEFQEIPLAKRADFLDAIAEEILKLGDALLNRTHEETALPLARLTGERGRTIGQLKMFANEVRKGEFQRIIIDRADPARVPAAKPDLRRMMIPLGPVAVFGASNFPLAFSVAGGDTASAFAAGCSVIFKAHPAHPGTCEMVTRAIHAAAENTGITSNVFSLLHGEAETGALLVQDPHIKAVAFTGSTRVGMTLFDLASERPDPIPVFAEMGSVNPVFVTANALAELGENIASGYANSLALGVGQFCTNPGILVLPPSASRASFVEKVVAALAIKQKETMLTAGIEKAYRSEVIELSDSHEVEVLLETSEGGPALFQTTAQTFFESEHLRKEIFGPAGIIVTCESEVEFMMMAEEFMGELTATIWLTAQDAPLAGKILKRLQAFAGRVVVNGFPTGVEVSPAMQHGGPFPATTDARFTSVGTAALERFLRPVCFQDVPQNLLPEVLRD